MTDTMALAGRRCRPPGTPGQNRARARVRRRAQPLLQARGARLSGAHRGLCRGHGRASTGAIRPMSTPALSTRCRCSRPKRPDDTSLTQRIAPSRCSLPCCAHIPDHPGLVHYIIHACDTPSLAPQGLAAARHYGEIAASGPMRCTCPGIFSHGLACGRRTSIRMCLGGGRRPPREPRHESDGMDQFHSDDFLLYAYLQSGQEARAKSLIDEAAVPLTHLQSMPGMSSHFMQGHVPLLPEQISGFLLAGNARLEGRRGARAHPRREARQPGVDLLGAHRGSGASAPGAGSA